MNLSNLKKPTYRSNKATARAIYGSFSLGLLFTVACDNEESLLDPAQEDAEVRVEDVQDPFAPTLLSKDILPPSYNPEFSPDEGWVYLGKSNPEASRRGAGSAGPGSDDGNKLFDELLGRAKDFESKGAFEPGDSRTRATWDGGYHVAMTSEGDIYAIHTYEGMGSSIDELPANMGYSAEVEDQAQETDTLVEDGYRTDNRFRMRGISKSKWRPIGAMMWKVDKNRFQAGCTGTQVGPRVVITAAHCVKDGALPYYFDAGRDGSSRFLRSRVQTGHFWIHPKYKSWKKIGKFDVAMLILRDSSKLDGVGYWGVSTSRRRQLKGETVRSCGYPGTDPKGKKGTAKPWCSKGKVKRVWGKRFRSATYLTRGQSGSAVWLDDEPQMVRGIHAGDGLYKEWHARITGDVIDELCNLRRRYTSKAYGKKDPSC